MAGGFDITGANPFGGARLIEEQPQQAPMVMSPEQQQQMMMVPPQQAGATTIGVDPAVAAKLFAPVEEIPYGY